MPSEIYRHGVDVRLSSYVDQDEILAERPDAVIVATGSMPRMDGIQNSNPGEPIEGVDAPHVLSSTDLLMDGRNWRGSSAVVLDDLGHYEAAGVADLLVREGADVIFVTPFTSFAPKVENALMTEPVLERMAKAEGNFTPLTRHRIRKIGNDQVEIAPTFDGPSFAVPSETVVLVTPNSPLRDIYELFDGKVAELVIVGDANSPRDLQKAIYEGHVAARKL